MRVKVGGTRKKRESKKERGLTGFLREEGSRVFWKKKVRKSKEKKKNGSAKQKKKKNREKEWVGGGQK